jgi:hypothetical protein
MCKQYRVSDISPPLLEVLIPALDAALPTGRPARPKEFGPPCVGRPVLRGEFGPNAY